jgi:hypothetical protein
MAKLTKKFAAALKVAQREGVPGYIAVGDNQETLYKILQNKGYMWRSNDGLWVFVADEPADEPTEFVRLRVWSDTEIVNEVADDLTKVLKKLKFKLRERSDAYRCRPPKQAESRIYLTFSPPEKG